MENTKKKTTVVQIIIFIVSFAFAFFVAKYFLSSGDDSVNKTLVKISKEMNATMPNMMDAETRLDSTSVDNTTLNYHYTLVNFPKDSVEIDFEMVKSEMMQKAQDNLDTNPVMKEYRENDISLHYIFKDTNKSEVFDYTVKHQPKK